MNLLDLHVRRGHEGLNSGEVIVDQDLEHSGIYLSVVTDVSEN